MGITSRMEEQFDIGEEGEWRLHLQGKNSFI